MKFKDLPIQKKLLRFIFFISGMVLLVTCITFFVYELYTFRQTTLEKLSTIGKIVSTNSTAALAFDSKGDAIEILSALKSEPHVVGACLYDKKGKLFAHYPLNVDPKTFPLKPRSEEGYNFTSSFLEGFQLVMQDKEQLGTLYLKSDLSAMHERLRLYGIIVTLVIALSSILSYLLSKILQKSISKPILDLAATAKIISDKADYSVRAVKIGADELGSLTDAFNNMLIQIQDQNQTLSEFNQNLEDKITRRTMEIETVNKELKEKEKEQVQLLTELKNTSLQIEQKNELLEGIAEVNDTLRGVKGISVLAQDIINKIVIALKAQIGVIYLANGNDEFSCVAGYAFNQNNPNFSVIRTGEGLVGQAILEQKCILFKEIPENYFKINSALGEILPKNIIVLPFIYNASVEAVIEIGSIYEFTERQINYLNQVASSIAIGFNSSRSRARLNELLEETQRQAEELEAQQEELKRSNNQLELKAKMLQDSEGQLKSQQEELQQTNSELKEKATLLEEKNEAIEVTKKELEKKAEELELSNKYKSEFLSTMSHELRTPLNSVLVLAEILSENKEERLGPKEVEYIKHIHDSGTDLLNLINEILDLTKIEAGRMELETEDVSIAEIIQKMKAMFDEVANTKSIDFKIHHDQKKQFSMIHTDGQRLEQILRNLLSNAFKFTSKGGFVKLEIGPASPDAKFSNANLYQSEHVFSFSVKDNGIGIPKEKQELVFEAFKQANSSTKRKFGGTGLGLSISKELSALLSGEVQLESEEGKGSIFTLFLPDKIMHTEQAAERHPVPLDKKTQIEIIPNENEKENAPLPVEEIDDRKNLQPDDKRILIIEDDLRFAKLLFDFVKNRNYKGIIALQGDIGLNYAKRYKPDAILLDMKLPVMDGNEVLKRLKDDPLLKHIPVMIISGYLNKSESIKLGALEFLQKPIKFEDLKTAFEKIEEFTSVKFKKLLIIEGDKQQNFSIQSLIEDNEVECVNAYSEDEAYHKLTSSSFDCVIVDMDTQYISGNIFLQKIRKTSKLKSIPIIVHTSSELTEKEYLELSNLANAIVVKTADSSERLLDEATMFLHKVESGLPDEKRKTTAKLHRSDESLKGKKILLADDDMRNVFVLSNVLEGEGMIYYIAGNGQEAVDMLEAHPDIEIVLMDIMMPEMDGFEASAMIRKNEKFRNLPIIALTAKAMKGMKEKCLAEGMSDYISKPIKVEQLLSLLRVWLFK
jgi:signal transduction histidine kinase/DNA-binding response OmpR family regulator